MANILEYPHGISWSIQFSLPNPLESATTNTVLSSGGANNDFLVPTGYEFHPQMITVVGSADITAGTIIANVTANGTALTTGPTVTLSDLVQEAVATNRVGTEPIAAGDSVGVNVVADASYAPNTIDYDVSLIGKLLPA